MPVTRTTPIQLLLTLALCVSTSLAGRPGEPDYVVIKAGKVITVSGDEIEGGQIVIEDGEITLVGLALETPGSATVIDATDQVVMPGIILAHTRYGLPRYNRQGVNGNLTVRTEWYPSEMDFDPLLRAGVTAIGLYPDGNGVPGTAAAYRTGGPEDDMLLSADAYLFGIMVNPGRDKRVIRGAFDKAEKEIEKVEKARKEWEKKQGEKKKAEAKKNADKKNDTPKGEEKPEGGEDPKPDPNPEPKPDSAPDDDTPEDAPGDKPKGEDGEKKDEEKDSDEFTPPPIDPAHRPFVDMIQGNASYPFLVQISSASDLVHLDDATRKWEDVEPAYYITGDPGDQRYVLDEYTDRESTILMQARVGTLPDTNVEYDLAGELFAGGCTVSFVPQSDSSWGISNFRDQLAMLTRYGLSRDDAIKGITLNPAKLLGIDDQVGSIQKERMADLVFFDGDPLDPSSRVTRVMIEGVTVWERDDK